MRNSIILMRHGTAEKNKRNEHGGAGSSLTTDGIKEIEEVSRNLIGTKIPIDIVYYVDRPQCIESATILANIFNIQCEVLGSIEPYNLGLLDGLSEEQAKSLHPEISQRMDLWRQGNIDITQLNIPGSTNPIKFVDNCNQVLNPILGNRSLVVATRSILVAFASIVLGRKPSPGGGYVEIPWKNSAFTVFKECNSGYSVDASFSTNQIKNS